MDTDFQNGRHIAQLEAKLSGYHNEVFAHYQPYEKARTLLPLAKAAFDEYMELAQQYGVATEHVANIYRGIERASEFHRLLKPI